MLFVYQLKVGICLIGFYLLLKLLLSRETLHRAYRLSMLGAVVLSALLPLAHFSTAQPSAIGRGMVVIEGIFAEAEVADVAPSASALGLADIIRLAYIIYIVGAVVTLLWHAWSHWRLRQLLRSGRSERLHDGLWLHVLPGDSVSPFSYFRHIVISEQDYRENPREILTHEQAHIRLHHSLDVLLMNLVVALQWWNPAAWLLRRELQQVHEFEADEAVLKRGVDARQYQLLLIRKSVGNQLFSMANNLNHQSLKKRIRMMTRKNRSSRWQQLRLLAVVPVAAVLAMACGQQSDKADEPLTVGVEVPSEGTSPETVIVGNEPAEADNVFDVVEQMPEFPGGTAELMKYLSQNLKYPKEAQAANEQGRVVVTFIVEADGTPTTACVVQGVTPLLDAEALRVVQAMPKWTPGMQNGKAVRVKYTVPVSFKLQ